MLNAVTLLLSIPPILITTPSLPFPQTLTDHFRYSFPAYTLAILILTALLSLLPTTFFRIASNLALFLVLLGSYVLPAVIHITAHNFEKPLSIVMPSTHPNPRSPSGSPGVQDELLQRKERSLQKRQLRRRLIWDIGVWVLLVPIGVWGIVWAFGKVGGYW